MSMQVAVRQPFCYIGDMKIEEKYIHTLDQMVDLVSEDKD